jgi:diguanylate cyclase (GGDEF)-like protein
MPQELINQLQQLIFTDDLTGLYNRRYMHFLMREAAAKGAFPAMSLIVLDLDRFKTINDTHGHQDGDAILKQLARILSENVPAGQTIVRFGGDEFIIVLQNTAKAQAVEIGESIRKSVAKKPFQLTKANQEVKLSVSVGVASSPDDAKTFDQLFAEADKALYFSKKTGRGRVTAAGRYDPAQVLDRTVHDQLGHPEFVNRVGEMDAIRRALQECTQGQPRFMMISGEAGSGKSRVLREALQLAKEKDMIYVFTRCAEYYSPSPYRVLINLVQVFTSRHPETIKPQLAQLSDEVFSTVCEVLPELGKLAEREPVPVKLQESQKRRYLFAALARIIWQLAQERAIVILIDNVHYIDQGTLEVIRWLLTARKAKIIFLATVPAEMVGTPAFKRSFVALFLEECSIESYYTSLHLEPLTSPDMTTLVRSLLPHAPLTEEFVGQLVEMSRGNPLYMTSVIRFLLNNDTISLQNGVWQIGALDRGAIPSSLEELLRKLFDSLDQEAVEFLTNAAVAGESFHIDTMRGSLDKNEGQLLDVVDKLMAQNLVDSSDAGQATNFEFLSRKTRAVSYETIDGAERQKVHQKIGEVEEKRLKSEGDSAADVLMHHFAKSGDTTRAKRYEEALTQRTKRMFQEKEIGDYQTVRPSDEESRIPEATKKLDPRGLALVGAMCRNLMNAIKISRVYPAGAPAVQQARQTLQGSMEETFASAEAVTLGQTEESLAVNTQEIPLTAFDGYASQIRILFTEKYIKSFTIGRGVSADEISAVVSLLSAKADPQQILSDPQYWAKRLDASKVRRADIIPLVFVEDKRASGEGDIDSTLVEGIKGVLKSLKGSVDALRYYPPGSAVIKENIQNLLDALSKVFQKWDELSVTLAEGRLVVNTIPADEVRFGSIVPELITLMGAKGLTSITLRREVTGPELDAVTRGLFNKDIVDEAGLGDFLTANNVEHIIVGQSTVAMKQYGSSVQQQVDVRSPADQAEQWLKLDDVLFTGDGVLYQLVNVVDGLYGMDRAEVAVKMIERFHKLVYHRDSAIGERAAEALDRLIHLGGHATSKAATEVARAAGIKLLDAKLAAKVRRHFVPMAQGWLAHELQASNWEGLATILEALRAQPESKLQENVTDILKRLQKDDQLAPVFAALKGAGTRPTATRIIRTLGASAEEPLLKIIRQSTEAGLIDAAANLLREINPQAWKPLVSLINAQTPVQECLNIMKTLCLLARGQSELGPLFASLLNHPESVVRFEALKSADAADPSGAERIIRTAIASKQNSLILQSLTQAVSLNLGTLGETVTTLMVTTEEDIIIGCCSYLSRFPRPESFNELMRIYETRAKFFGLKKGLKDATRAAALVAIAALKTPQADEIVEQALKEKSVEVRGAARAAKSRSDHTALPH